MAYSKIMNKLFYTKEEGQESILKIVNDNKVVLVMHYLYCLTNRFDEATVSVDYLIEKCGYKVTKKAQFQFKDILVKLDEIGVIELKDEINSYSRVIEINTAKLNVDSEFFVMEEEELELIKSIAEDTREYINLIKVYFYLKARIHKGNDVRANGGKSQTTFNTYLDIANTTFISERNIKKYIDKLQDINLIRYENLGYKYKPENINLKTECANLYALTKISTDDDWIKADLKEGLKQQEHYYEENGYVVTKKGYKNNDKKTNGKYGSLIKKEKNNNLTDKEKEELSKIRLTYELMKE